MLLISVDSAVFFYMLNIFNFCKKKKKKRKELIGHFKEDKLYSFSPVGKSLMVGKPLMMGLACKQNIQIYILVGSFW